jgi:hypothetical protein
LAVMVNGTLVAGALPEKVATCPEAGVEGVRSRGGSVADDEPPTVVATGTEGLAAEAVGTEVGVFGLEQAASRSTIPNANLVFMIFLLIFQLMAGNFSCLQIRNLTDRASRIGLDKRAAPIRSSLTRNMQRQIAQRQAEASRSKVQ